MWCGSWKRRRMPSHNPFQQRKSSTVELRRAVPHSPLPRLRVGLSHLSVSSRPSEPPPLPSPACGGGKGGGLHASRDPVISGCVPTRNGIVYWIPALARRIKSPARSAGMTSENVVPLGPSVPCICDSPVACGGGSGPSNVTTRSWRECRRRLRLVHARREAPWPASTWRACGPAHRE
jgi:hypothetical protein